MNTSKFITAVVGNEKITYAEPITRVDYGLRLRIKGIALPDSYEVDFSQNEEGGESVTVIGDAQGAEIPAFLIKTGKDIYAFLFWVGEGYGRRVKKIMIPNEAGPDRTDIAPEPAEQSVIDQTIAKLNGAVSHAPDRVHGKRFNVGRQTSRHGSACIQDRCRRHPQCGQACDHLLEAETFLCILRSG